MFNMSLFLIKIIYIYGVKYLGVHTQSELMATAKIISICITSHGYSVCVCVCVCVCVVRVPEICSLSKCPVFSRRLLTTVTALTWDL